MLNVTERQIEIWSLGLEREIILGLVLVLLLLVYNIFRFIIPIGIFFIHFTAVGFTQTYGVNYQETFAPLEKTKQNFKNAFLYGDLHEAVCMSLPPAYNTSGDANLVGKLKKVLYGLNNHHVNDKLTTLIINVADKRKYQILVCCLIYLSHTWLILHTMLVS